MEPQNPDSQSNLEQKRTVNAGEIITANFKILYRTIVIKREHWPNLTRTSVRPNRRPAYKYMKLQASDI